MLDFYRDVRADGCELQDDGDMLLFQWGVFDFGEGRTFRFDLTRQFIVTDPEDDDESSMSQLSFTFHFVPSPTFEAIKEGHRWCNAPGKLTYFEGFIIGSEAYEAASTTKPARVTLEFGAV